MTGGQILAGILGVAAIAYIGRPIITGIFKNKQRKLEAKKSNHQHEAHRQAIDALKTVCLAQNKATSEYAFCKNTRYPRQENASPVFTRTD